MKRPGWFTSLICVLLLSSLAYVAAPAARTPPPHESAPDKAFDPGCRTLPFEAIKMKRPIDDTCPRGGSAAGTDPTGAHALENLAKNNFCATGNPVPVTYAAFVALQDAVNKMTDLPWGEGTRLPPDRSKLLGLKIKDSGRSLTLGEGTKVVFVGYVMDAKHDDTAKGEDVNCKIPGNESNDIHISLRTVPGAQSAAPKGKPDLRCNSITAEISPHFRPAVWDKFDSEPYRPVFQKYPVRITGTLLFDAAHHPCANGIPSAGNPVRISVWEIHPVYAIDVCKYPTITRCKAGDQSAWTPFDKYQIGS